MSAKKTKGARGSKKKREDKPVRLDKESAAAVYYGFSPVEVKLLDRDTLAKAKKMLEIDPKKDSEIMQQFDSTINLDEKISLLQHIITSDHNLSQPSMVYFKKKSSDKNVRCGLEVIGTSKSVTEATLIKVTLEILKEEGYDKVFVEINSIGDKESLARLTRELTNYYRKHINDLPAQCRQLLKRDVFEVLLFPHEKCILLRDDAPKSMNYLTELSREHFREVLEFLERMGIAYQIVSSLVGNRKYANHVVFEIKEGEPGTENAEVLARGIRYNGIAKKLGSRKDIPAAGVALSFKPKHAHRDSAVSVKKPKIYFIQLGFEAKLKSLKVIEMLRQEKIPVQQSLSKDKLTSQLATAEHLRIPYVLIMGQKEAMEDSIIVRNSSTRSQETVRIADLPTYIKKL
jgi:histidyl-tRNA synthetase